MRVDATRGHFQPLHHAVDDGALNLRAASRLRFGGHGSAMAQAYGHLIMPLATDADRRTQVRWGVADFAYRFKRAPEGMWLPECAVDVPSLEALAEQGIAFTVLAPHQALRWRPLPPDRSRSPSCRRRN